MRYIYGKVGLCACLFLCPFISAVAQRAQWSFDAHTQLAYDYALSMKFAQVYETIPDPQTPQEIYVSSLAEVMELMLLEDGEKYAEYRARFEKRKDKKTRANDPDEQFMQAELSVQWAFVYFKFGHEFDAALNLKDAYSITSATRRKHPSYTAIKKTAAFLEIIVGSVPEKYNWVLSLLGIQGSIDEGLRLFESVHQSGSPLTMEADLLHALVQSYVLQHHQAALDTIEQLNSRHRDHPLILFIGSSIAIKNSQGERALSMLNRLEETQPGFRLDYADYLRGELYLCKAEYLNSITAYRSFLAHYKGQNNLKDAHYKIGLCYWLNGNSSDAISTFKTARTIGKDVTEADKYAARSLADEELPHPVLTRARYFIDGGYYPQASAILDSIKDDQIPTQRDKVEYAYRRARLAHKQQNIAYAKLNYKKVIDQNGQSPWYFGPNASLQMGYILVDEHNLKDAEEYFEMALSYKKHEYKNSIDTKARTALAQLRRK